jgi:ComF family protein
MGRVKVENVASLLFYKKGNMTQNILHHLKYKGNKELGRFLGQYYGTKLIEKEAYKKIDVIIPIPLHQKKLKKRGYNQSEWIAIGLSEAMGIPCNTTTLIRTNFTETQTKKSRIDRWENVKNVFQIIDENSIKGKHILICDDVLTTGATMEAAIKQILEIEKTLVSVVTLGTTHG